MMFTPENIAIIGGNGGIGRALINYYLEHSPAATIHAFARDKIELENSQLITGKIVFDNEQTIADAAQQATWDLVIVAIGILTDELVVKPEKSFKNLTAENLQHIYQINTIYPALVAKYFLPNMNKQSRSVFAAMSARVGSIADNKRGGWHAYRASKAALNMLIKNFAIEMKIFNHHAIIIGLHPGTVDTNLSKNFQANVPTGQLFTPAQAADYLANVISKVTLEQSGHCLAWNGEQLMP